MSQRYPSAVLGYSRLMSSGSSGSVLKWKCESVLDARTTARRPVRSIALAVARPRRSISSRPSSVLR